MKRIIPLMLLLIIGSKAVNAQIPQYITFQGVLTEADGNPKPDGNYSIDFKIYDQPSGGTSKYSQNESVSIKRGVFSVKLGPLPATLRFDVPYYLGITVSGGTEMSPRIALNSTPYSLSSVRADTARTTLDGGITSAKITSGAISDGHVASEAAIAGTKITPNFGTQNITTSGSVTATSFSGDGSALTNVGAGSIPDGSITSTKILDGTITNADINATAGIATSKISGTVTSISGHGLGSLATKNTVDSSTITDGSITNADIRANAGISGTKINPDFGSQKIITTDSIITAGMRAIGCRVFLAATQSVLHSTNTLVAFDSEAWDFGGLHNNVNPTRLTAPVSGFYFIYGTAVFAPNVQGERFALFRLNASQYIASEDDDAISYSGEPTDINLSCVFYLNAGDFVEFNISQTSGNSMSIGGQGTDHRATSFGMHKLP